VEDFESIKSDYFQPGVLFDPTGDTRNFEDSLPAAVGLDLGALADMFDFIRERKNFPCTACKLFEMGGWRSKRALINSGIFAAA